MTATAHALNRGRGSDERLWTDCWRGAAALAGVELRQVARFAMTIVAEQAVDHPGRRSCDLAAVIAEIGDVSRFETFDQLLAYAGVHPAERSSGMKGSKPETSWHMSKAGNGHLRAAAYRIAVVGVTHNPIIREHYQRKRAAGKSKLNALGQCMRRALSIVWGVWRSGDDFDSRFRARA